MTLFRRWYGDRPLHLLALLGLLLVTAYVAGLLLGTPPALRIAVWFVGAAVVWDLVVAPLLALADRALQPLGRLRVPAVNHVRVPALLSALLLLVAAPLILQRSEGPYGAASGLTQDPYLGRWLLVTALLFGGSAIAYAAAVLRSGRSRA